MILDRINSLLCERVIITEKLPFDLSALEPYISKDTVNEHYNRHYKSYLRKLFSLIKNTKYDKLDILDIIDLSKQENSINIYNNSAQVLNHEFYFNSLKLNTKNNKLKEIILSKFLDIASMHFGSGWIWIVQNKKNKNLDIISTLNADRPIENIYKLLAVCDVWEHSYYLDYKSKRDLYFKNFINYLLNWEFVEKNLI